MKRGNCLFPFPALANFLIVYANCNKIDRNQRRLEESLESRVDSSISNGNFALSQ